MATDEEIRAAELGVIEAARMLRPKPSEHFLAIALAKLDALQSPLPSRDEMASRHIEGLNWAPTRSGAMAEWHWVDCLRWVATQIRGNVGSNQTSDDCDGFADELEARK